MEKQKVITDEDFFTELSNLLSKAVTYLIEQDAPTVSVINENTSNKNINIL
jgi:hypothetical protein